MRESLWIFDTLLWLQLPLTRLRRGFRKSHPVGRSAATRGKAAEPESGFLITTHAPPECRQTFYGSRYTGWFCIERANILKVLQK